MKEPTTSIPPNPSYCNAASLNEVYIINAHVYHGLYLARDYVQRTRLEYPRYDRVTRQDETTMLLRILSSPFRHLTLGILIIIVYRAVPFFTLWPPTFAVSTFADVPTFAVSPFGRVADWVDNGNNNNDARTEYTIPLQVFIHMCEQITCNTKFVNK